MKNNKRTSKRYTKKNEKLTTEEERENRTIKIMAVVGLLIVILTIVIWEFII